MGDELHVDLDLLGQTAGSLGMLIEEFHRASDIAKGEQSHLGSPTVIDGMEDWVSAWDKHREDLLKSMQAVYDMATKSREAYIKADNDLAKAISDATTQETVTVPGGGR